METNNKSKSVVSVRTIRNHITNMLATIKTVKNKKKLKNKLARIRQPLEKYDKYSKSFIKAVQSGNFEQRVRFDIFQKRAYDQLQASYLSNKF